MPLTNSESIVQSTGLQFPSSYNCSVLPCYFYCRIIINEPNLGIHEPPFNFWLSHVIQNFWWLKCFSVPFRLDNQGSSLLPILPWVFKHSGITYHIFLKTLHFPPPQEVWIKKILVRGFFVTGFTNTCGLWMAKLANMCSLFNIKFIRKQHLCT